MYVDSVAMTSHLRKVIPSGTVLTEEYFEENEDVFKVLTAGGFGSCFLFMFSRPIQKGNIAELFRKVSTLIILFFPTQRVALRIVVYCCMLYVVRCSSSYCILFIARYRSFFVFFLVPFLFSCIL